MTSPSGCSSWLFLALLLGVITCLIDNVWVPPFRPYNVWRSVLFIVIIVLGVICYLR
jgi:hypothetical protein